MTRIKGYCTMEELANRLGWHYPEVFGLARMMDFRKVGRFYLVSETEVTVIDNKLAELSNTLRDIRDGE